MTLPDIDVPVQLRLTPEAVGTVTGFDPDDAGPLADRAELTGGRPFWMLHSPVTVAHLGHALSSQDPDRTMLRQRTEPVGGFRATAQAG